MAQKPNQSKFIPLPEGEIIMRTANASITADHHEVPTSSSLDTYAGPWELCPDPECWEVGKRKLVNKIRNGS